MYTHIRKVPELLGIDFQCSVITGVGISPDVSKPHIIAMISQDVSQALVGQVSQPVGAGAE